MGPVMIVLSRSIHGDNSIFFPLWAQGVTGSGSFPNTILNTEIFFKGHHQDRPTPTEGTAGRDLIWRQVAFDLPPRPTNVSDNSH